MNSAEVQPLEAHSVDKKVTSPFIITTSTSANQLHAVQWATPFLSLGLFSYLKIRG
jgi:hypothetical protein